MAKAGFRVMDSDIHVIEPHDLWQRYIEPAFRDRAPRFAAIDGSDYEGWQFDGKVFISSDWPHDDSAYPHAIDEFLALPGVGVESKRKILWDNCARLYAPAARRP